MAKSKPEPPPQAEGGGLQQFTESDITLIESNLKTRFFELARKENEAGVGKDKKLSAEIDKIQAALIKIAESKK